MRIVVHDFSGHPFQAELARRLAGRGHDVVHVSASQYESGKGRLSLEGGDPRTLSFEQIAPAQDFDKYSPLQRIRWEIAYGIAWLRRVRHLRPDAVVMCNVPLVAMMPFVALARLVRLRWVFWHQDIYSHALAGEARRRLPRGPAGLAARAFEAMEAWAARSASHVVAIGEAFTRTYRRWRVPAHRSSVIPNWAPLDEIVPLPRDNASSGSLYPSSTRLRLLYAGTLGRKHNPVLLLGLVRAVRAAGVDAHLTVVSGGEAADNLQAAAAADPSLPVTVLPFQPPEELPAVLGSADVLVSLLEPDATEFSIPSKVLSYMAAGRPILGLMPTGNPAAADIRACGGLVVEPADSALEEAAAWVATLSADPHLVEQIGKDTRARAEERFDADRTTTRFEELLASPEVPAPH